MARDERLHQVLEGDVRARLRVRDLASHLGQQLAEREAFGEARPERLRVRHVADERHQLRPRAVGDGRADDDVRLAAVAVQQRLPRGQHRHVAGEALAAREGHQLVGERGREVQRHALGGDEGLVGAGPVGGQIQLARHAGQPLPPPLVLFSQAAARDATALPCAEVRVLEGQRLERRRLALDEGVVELAQLLDEQGDGHRVADDVVDAGDQQVQLRVQTDQGGAQHGAADQVERLRGILAGEPQGFGLARLQRAAQLHAREGHVHARVEALHGAAVHGVVGRAQRFVALDDLLDAALHHVRVQVAFEPEDEGEVVRGQAGQVLLQAPDALLHEGQRQLAAVARQRHQRKLRGDGGLRRLEQQGLQALRDARDGGRFEEGGQRQVHAKGLTELVEQLRGRQRVAAELQEVVMAAHELQAQTVAPQRGHALLDVATRRVLAAGRGRGGGGQGGFHVRRHGSPV
nr:hypothetical protein [Corallococcus coralloides]